VKQQSDRVLSWFSRLTGRSTLSQTAPSIPPTASLEAGDLVRVKSKEEIEATLDRWKSLKGCSFMSEMWPHCGTTQRVLKRIDRFFDERDYKLKRIRGIVLLEGTMCQGTEMFGRCDRSCFFFWREEWLERLDDVVTARQTERHPGLNWEVGLPLDDNRRKP
jgi:hypothetical protein